MKNIFFIVSFLLIFSCNNPSHFSKSETPNILLINVDDLGWKESGLDRVISMCYKTLNLISFFTTGEKETRAWTVEAGSTGPQAAGKIHTDFEKAYIRGEVIAYSDFVELGGESQARDAGKLRVEGKEYIVQDGDVCHFRVGV